MIISVTERQTYKRCERKWDFSSFNRQSLTPATSTSGALDLGTLIHKSLADRIVKRAYTADEARSINKNKLDELLLDADSSMVEVLTEQFNMQKCVSEGQEIPLVELFQMHGALRMIELEANYRKITGGAKPNVSELSNLFDVIELGVAMMRNYEGFHGAMLPKNMRFASPEQKCRVPIPGTTCELCRGEGKRYNYAAGVPIAIGTDVCPSCDGTGQHILEGTLDGLIQDDRERVFVLEHKTYGRRPNMRTLETADQFLAYIWILHKLGIGKVGGVAYDGMWKRATPPKNATMKDLFLRTPLNRTQAQLDEFEVHVAEEATRMANNKFPTFNRRWEGCYDCGYEKLCTTVSNDEDVAYIRNTLYTTRLKDDPIGVADIDDD